MSAPLRGENWEGEAPLVLEPYGYGEKNSKKTQEKQK